MTKNKFKQFLSTNPTPQEAREFQPEEKVSYTQEDISD